jgi:hypothetical protein
MALRHYWFQLGNTFPLVGLIEPPPEAGEDVVPATALLLEQLRETAPQLHLEVAHPGEGPFHRLSERPALAPGRGLQPGKQVHVYSHG